MSKLTNYNDIEEIRNDWEFEQAKAYDLADAWDHVRISTKADGTPYKRINQNFCGCAYGVVFGKNALYVTIGTRHGNAKDSVYTDGKTFEQICTEIADRKNELVLRGDKYTQDLNHLDRVYETFQTAYVVALMELIPELSDKYAVRAVAETVVDECNWKVGRMA